MSTIKSVFFVASGNPTSGFVETSSYVTNQADSIKRVGWEVFMSIVDDRTSLRGVLRNILRMRREVIHVKPGVIHAHYGSVTAALAYCIKGRLPLVISFCGSDLLGWPHPGLLWRLREGSARAIGLAAACGAAVIIVKSLNLLDELPVRMRRKAVVLPNGVDMSWFKPLDKLQARTRLGWPKEARVVLFNTSTQTNQIVKNPSLARASIDILRRAVPHVTLQLMSGASREEVLWMLNASDCLLVTSFHEGSPNIVKEAMACNLPVVSVLCGDVAERLTGTFPGKICPYDAFALAGALEEVLQAGGRSNGREQLVAQGLSAMAIAERLTQIYISVQQGDSIPMELHKTACVE